MQDYLYFDLSGGIDYSKPNTILKSNKRIYWLDSKNVEIYKGSGLSRMKGCSAILKTPIGESITSMGEYIQGDEKHLILATDSGNFYFFDASQNALILKKSGLDENAKMSFASFSNGVVCTNGVDEPFFFELGAQEEIKSCNAYDINSNPIRGNAISVYKGRVWISDGSTLYYSALGMFDDWSSEEDAGYISNFHNDTSKITALKNYKDYLAIYKTDQTYLLQGNDYSDYAITKFSDKGCPSPFAVSNAQNRQFFYSNGVYSLELTGELNQISVSSELSLNIKEKVVNTDQSRLDEAITIAYEAKDQIWFYLPRNSTPYLNVTWIYDFNSKAWLKRVSPKNITSACVIGGKIFSANTEGQLYLEDTTDMFDDEAIEFDWISSYFVFTGPNYKKSLEEFFLILDDGSDNKFDFSVSKDFMESDFEDSQRIIPPSIFGLVWDGGNWNENDTGTNMKWYPEMEVSEKALISGSNKGISLRISGSSQDDDFSLVGIEFRGVLSEQ